MVKVWRNQFLPEIAAPLSGRSLVRCSLLGCLVLGASTPASNAETVRAARFNQEVLPVLTQYCSDCHADGSKKGNVDFDEVKSEAEPGANRELWLKVLKNVRAGLMPPARKARPSLEERQRLFAWIESDSFGIDPRSPDPGRVTIRRLNRVEYRNTIRDLMGVDFDTEQEFPPDDTGHGFDDIGEVLTLSPMLIEKYLSAAKTVVERAVPIEPLVPPESRIAGKDFERIDSSKDGEGTNQARKETVLSYYEPATVLHSFRAPHDGQYQIRLALTANEKFVDGQFDYNKCRLRFKADGLKLFQHDYMREGGKSFQYEFMVDWHAGQHPLSVELEPLTSDAKRVRNLTIRIDSVTVHGPISPKSRQYWVRPKNYERFFPGKVPSDPGEHQAYARQVIGQFTRKAFRRPVDAQTIDRLADLARSVYSEPGKSFEAGLAQAMVAVLASPRFLFLEEGTEPTGPGKEYPLVDEYALASRLSYFLWSSMPDDPLFRLASEGKLRANLPAQFKRLLADGRAEAFVRNFTGQWLQARDIETVPIEVRAVMSREFDRDPAAEKARQRFRELIAKAPESLTPEEKEELAKTRGNFARSFNRFSRFDLTTALRQDMRRETEKYFEYVVRENRSLLELLDSDYTFLNKRLADYYEIPGVDGDEIHKVTLSANSPRGGILTQGTVLAVTSNPTRTSPVKRGLFILDNILGAPPPPPPPDIPPLEDAAKNAKDHEPSLRETLALHRESALCSSCHNRMDPLGLALENFNALGRWREKEHGQSVDVAGKLITGEDFTNIRELKHILATKHQNDFYRCLTEKLLTYALGRGLEYYDECTVDHIVDALDQDEGRPSTLLMGIIQSAPFQHCRGPDWSEKPAPPKSPQQRADLSKKP